MAATVGPASADVGLAAVEELLRENPCEFQFFQAVRLLERLAGDRQPVGRFAHPTREAVHFAVHNSLAFPASQIQRIEWPEDGPPTIFVNFMGLTGPSGVLPLSYTELVIERLRAKDSTLAAFFDIFNHRLISFFYQAWEKYNFPVAYERGDDMLSRQLSSLIGIGTPGLENRQAFPDDPLRFYAGPLSLQPRSADALHDLLADYFGVPVDIEQFVGAWYPLGTADQCQFAEGDTASEQLGIGTVAGDAVWDEQSRIRIRLGPLTLRQYLDFLPTGSAYEPLRALVRFFVNNTVDFEVQLVLRRDEVPACELAGEGDQAPRLGWITWMKSTPRFGRDPGDTVLRFDEGT
jgi:type VI secretion system protein ImpH